MYIFGFCANKNGITLPRYAISNSLLTSNKLFIIHPTFVTRRRVIGGRKDFIQGVTDLNPIVEQKCCTGCDLVAVKSTNYHSLCFGRGYCTCQICTIERNFSVVTAF